MIDRRPPVALAISDGSGRPARELVEWALRLSDAGVDAVQLREKALTDVEVFHRARELAVALRSSATRLIINSRFDIAVAAEADGVHLPATGLSPNDVRQASPRDFLIGCSTHSLSEISTAIEAGADYVTYGPVFDTPSKSRFGSPQGLEGLRQAASLGGWVVALGGIEPNSIPAIVAAGASGFAGIRMFQEGTDTIEAAVRSMRGGQGAI